jgi:hypothetical protein
LHCSPIFSSWTCACFRRQHARPYFYHLLAEGWHERRLTLSSTYRDATSNQQPATSNQYCLTAGQFFDNGERLLLIDVDAAGF